MINNIDLSKFDPTTLALLRQIKEQQHASSNSSLNTSFTPNGLNRSVTVE